MHSNVRRVRVFASPRLSGDLASDVSEIRHAAPKGEIPFVVAGYISRAGRKALEQEGISYLSGRGDFFLRADDLLVFVQSKAPTRAPKESVLGLGGVRLVQSLLGERSRPWSIKDVAQSAGVSRPHALGVMRLLEQRDLLYAVGSGPRKRRHVRDASALLDWVAAQRPGQRPSKRAAVSLYGRTEREVIGRIDAALAPVNSPYAVTGSAGAALYGAPVTSSQGPTIIRIDPTLPLDQAVDLIGGEETDRGANVVLWSDRGRLGTHGSERRDGLRVAPQVRIFIDLHAQMRGEDMATAFTRS